MAARICVECGQSRTIRARKMCDACYQRLKWNGQLDKHGLVIRRRAEWFSLVDTSDPEACWPWPGTIRKNGYGQIGNDYPHRIMFEQANGPIPPGMTVDHTCHSRSRDCRGGDDCLHRSCVNPGHLEVVSRPENVRRTRNRVDKCDDGHEYTTENTVIDQRGYRKCRECQAVIHRASYEKHRDANRERSRAYYAKNRAAIRAKQNTARLAD